MAGVVYNRMQNLNLTGNCDNNFYHYCYVCNTQLNSCKQALLHCSGKRHRKKLQFLQARKGGQFAGAVTPLAPDADRSAFQFPAALAGPPAAAPAPTLVATNSAGPAQPGPTLVTALPTGPPAPNGSPFYPYMAAPFEHWLTPLATAPPPHFVHFHGQLAPVAAPAPPSHYPNAHVPTAMHHPIRPLRAAFLNTAHAQPRPLLRYNESLRSVESSSPLMMTDTSAFGSGNSSMDARSVIISPSETSSISSESLVSPTNRLIYQCHVCQRQFITSSQLHVHLQTSRHYKQYLAQTGGRIERAGDSSETESWVSSSSIYYCMLCNIAVNSSAHLEAHMASHKHKQRVPTAVPAGHHRAQSRSSSTSSETPIELLMDSGYVSGSGDELICVSHPTADKPTAKFRCQICNVFLNSPAQAKQHLESQKHRQRVSNARPSFRRKPTGSFMRKHCTNQQMQKQISQQYQNMENGACMKAPGSDMEDCASGSGATRSLDTPSPDDDIDRDEEVDNDDDNATLVRCCHSL